MYANVVAEAVKKLQAQGDLMLRDMPDQNFLTTSKHTNWKPIADSECIDILEGEYYLFSDSVLKLGKKNAIAHKWKGQYERGIQWMKKGQIFA